MSLKPDFSRNRPLKVIAGQDLVPDEERRLAAILAADVVGFSSLMDADEPQTFANIKRLFNEVIEPQVHQHKGRVFKQLGDGFLVEFASVVNAVRCAIAIQTEMSVWRGVKDASLQLRIGVNLGDIIVDGNDVYGSGVNLASRLEAMAEPGGICVTAQAYDQLRSVLDAAYEDIGEQTFKNIAEPVRVYKVNASTEPGMAGRVRRIRRRKPLPIRHAIVAAIALVVVGVSAWFVNDQISRPNDAAGGSDRLAVAVRSFQAVANDKKALLVSEGLTEDIVTALSRVPELHVADRNLVRESEAEGADSRSLAAALAVSHFLEGSIESRGEKLRINVRLVDAKTGSNIWAQRYDRDSDQLFVMRDEITLNVISSLHIELLDGQFSALTRKSTTNLEAWLLHREALEHAFRFTRSENEIAKQMLEEATELDPKFVIALVELGWRHLHDADSGWTASRSGSLAIAEEIAQEANAIAPENASVYALIAGIRLLSGDYEESVAAAKRAVEIAPQSAEVAATYAWALAYAGHYAEAIVAGRRSLELAPWNPEWYHIALAKALHLDGQPEEAIVHHRAYLERSPKGRRAAATHLNLAVIYAEQGDSDTARDHIRQAWQAAPDLTLSDYEAWSHLKDKAYLRTFVEQIRSLEQDDVGSQ